MTNNTSTEIIDRLIDLSVDIINYCKNSGLPRSVVDQVTRSSTSIGANFTEAQDASSRKDFVNKIFIAKKEAAETRYWLQIIARLSPNDAQIRDFADRTQKFVMMLQKIINSSKAK